jgi:hypothetical protein
MERSPRMRRSSSTFNCWACSRIYRERGESTEALLHPKGKNLETARAGCTISTVPVADAYALTTLPLRMQEVQTRMRLVVAPTRA